MIYYKAEMGLYNTTLYISGAHALAKTILVVDDEPGIVMIVRDYLEKAGFRVITAGDGPTALRLARLERPNLMVLDVMLPGIGGLDIIRTLRSDVALHLMSVIMLTA